MVPVGIHPNSSFCRAETPYGSAGVLENRMAKTGMRPVPVMAIPPAA